MQAQRPAPQEGVDYYKTFGLEFGASDEEIKKRHKVLALQLHPDKNKDDPDAQRKFQEMQETYDFLSTPDTKAMIDKWAVERLRKQSLADELERKRQAREFQELEQERAAKFRPCLYYCESEGYFTKNLDPIQARPKHFCETVASMKQRFEDTNKDDDDAIRAKKAQDDALRNNINTAIQENRAKKAKEGEAAAAAAAEAAARKLEEAKRGIDANGNQDTVAATTSLAQRGSKTESERPKKRNRWENATA